MDRYGPKHVELTPMHQYTISVATLCISLECIYILKLVYVHCEHLHISFNDVVIFQGCKVQG